MTEFRYMSFVDPEGFPVVEIVDGNNVVWVPRTLGVHVDSENRVVANELEKQVKEFGLEDKEAFVEFDDGTKRYLVLQEPLYGEAREEGVRFFSERVGFRLTKVMYDDGTPDGWAITAGFYVIPKQREDLLKLGETGSGLRLFNEHFGFFPEEGMKVLGTYVGEEYHRTVAEHLPSIMNVG